MNDKTKTKSALKSQRAATIPAPKRSIDFQVDTVTVDQANSSAAYFMSSDKTITVNYVEEGYNNSFNESKATKAHEQKHRDNYNAGMTNMPMNLEQYYKISAHDEISANMAELLQLREEYKNAKTDKEREKIISSPSGEKFSYYFDAVKSKQINPFATNSADFEKEMRFIATDTQKMWMDQYSQWYDPNLISHTYNYANAHDYKDLKSNPENYEKARKIAYTIGGIDFTKYMNDIPCINNNIKQADKMIAADKPRHEVTKMIKSELFGTQNKLTSLNQQAQLSALQPYADALKETMELRKKWLACKSDKEREALKQEATGIITLDWMNAVEQGKLKPNSLHLSAEEQKFLGNQVAMWTNTECGTNMDDIRMYVDNKGEQAIQQAIQSGEADKNYNKAVKEMFTVDGIDYSQYVNNPIVMEPNLAVADDKLKNKEPLNINQDLKEFDDTKDLIVPKFEPINGLSMDQQLRLAEHQMLMENVKARNPAIKAYVQNDIDNQKFDMNTPLAEQLKNQPKLFPTKEDIDKAKEVHPTEFNDNGDPISPYITPPQDNSSIFIPGPTFNAEITQASLKNFQQDLKNNPELKEKWDEAVDKINFNIARANDGTVFLTSDNDKKYQQELDKIYTVNGVNLKNSMADNFKEKGSVENYVPKAGEPSGVNWIEQVKSRSKTDRLKYKVAQTYVETKEWVGNKTNKAKTWAKKKAKETTEWVSDTWTSFTNFVTGNNEPQKAAPAKQATVKKQPAQQKDTSYRNKVYEAEHYTGKPKYQKWSPDHRVSPVLTAKIYDMTSPFLKQQQELLAQKDAEKAQQEALLAQNQVRTDKFNKKVEASRGAKASDKDKKKTTTKQTTKTQTNTKTQKQTQQNTR